MVLPTREATQLAEHNDAGRGYLDVDRVGVLLGEPMKCPECGVWTVVKDVRPSDTYDYRRRRECANGHRFTTQEVVIPDEQIKAEQRERLRNNNLIGKTTRRKK